MVKKKSNPAKENKKLGDNWVHEDVKVHTGLPPKVDGQLRCFCKVSVNQVLWAAASPPTTIVHIKWWGEDGEGAFFRPLDVKKGNKDSARTTARYPVRSGPRQFASYLNDMGALNLEVFTAETATQVVGTVQISEVSLLSNNRPVNGFFPIFSQSNEKLGEVQVSIMLEPLMTSYDKLGTVPTTDVNTDLRQSQDSMLPLARQPTPHAHQPVKPQEDPFISPASHLADNPRHPIGNRTQNISDLRQQLKYGLEDGGRGQNNPVAITTNGDAVTMSSLHGNGVPVASRSRKETTISAVQSEPDDVVSAQAAGGSDLLSVLLNRGNTLRRAMVISSLNKSDELEQNNNSIINSHKVPTTDTDRFDQPSVQSHFHLAPSITMDNLLGDVEHSAADMLIGSPVSKYDWQMLQLMNGVSPGTSLCSDVLDTNSEPGDPLHDQSLLQELFYKHSESELSDLSMDEGAPLHRAHSSSSLQDPGNMRPPSRSSSFSSLAALETAPEKKLTKSRKRRSKPHSLTDSPKATRRSRSEKKVLSETKTLKKSKRSRSRSSSLSGSRSRSRSRLKSRSRSRKRNNSQSGASDSDVPSTPRSETSRVSFDPVPSDAEEVDPDVDARGKQLVDGLSVERLTLLGRVSVARVSITSLHLQGVDLDTTCSSKNSARGLKHGKPPRPVKSRKPCTYLVEYQFPVVATSRDKYAPNAMATEVMRVASKNINNGVVTFNHRSVFPLMFDGAALEKWWKSALVFKVFSREAGQQAPVLVGSCGIPLKSILKSDDLNLTRNLEIRELNRNSSLNSSARSSANSSLLGTIKVSVELSSDHKDFATALAKTRVAEMNSHGSNIIPVVPLTPHPIPQQQVPHLPAKQKNTSAFLSATSRLPGKVIDYPVQEPQTLLSSANSVLPNPVPLTQEWPQLKKPTLQASIAQSQPDLSVSSTHESLALHVLIMVPDGSNISIHGVPPLHMATRHPMLLQQQLSLIHGSSGRDQVTRNTYLVCRMFWCNDAVHSSVCWGTLNPQYNFLQVAPVIVSASLLERMRNNYMIIEVWDKKTSAENDKLIGITKLSLHQFFMSFRDPKIAGALLRSEYPVVGIDNYMPIVDPFSGLHYGQLRVLLAMGSPEQVAHLQRLKADNTTIDGPLRPHHFLERQDLYNGEHKNIKVDSSGTSVEHVFEVVIDGVRGLKLLETMIHGEADCFIQYYFPSQGATKKEGLTIAFAAPTMRSFRTPTTLCIPDPTFNDVTRHKITMPVGTPVQRELLIACANSCGGSGGLPFEVWCRFYHPNVREQVIARTTLPLAKLCAMVTMQKRGESSVQTFSLPLTSVSSDSHSQDAEGQAKMKDAGLIDVTVHYKSHTVEVSLGTSQHATGSQVCISVGIIRAAGLKAAAEAAAKLDSGMLYPAEVGVNSYVRVRLSFCKKQDERVTKTVARTFCPEFSHFLDFPVPLLWSDNQADPMSLAQLLETGQVEMEVWHQVPGSLAGAIEFECDQESGNKRLVQHTGDVLLGTCSVPLVALIIRHAGLNGWFPIERPNNSWAAPENSTTDLPEISLSRMVGGLEISVHFAHTTDRQHVLEAARSIGWSPMDQHIEQKEWQDEGEETGKQEHFKIIVSVESAAIPLSRALLTGQTTLDPSARLYIRYKFYDRTAIVSRTARLQGDGERLQALLQHRHSMILQQSSPFHWYLREERMEVQVWVTYGSKGQGQRPLQRDKLIGTAYVDLSPLTDTHRRQHRISGLLPLFKPGASSLAGAFVQLQVTSKLCKKGQLSDEDEDEVLENSNLTEMSDAEYDSADSFHQLVGGHRSPSKQVADAKKGQPSPDEGQVFTVHLAIERAMHLPTVRQSTKSEEVPPTTYVSFQTAGRTAPMCSEIVPTSTDPVWDYVAEVSLSTDLLTQRDKNLVLKVWHKPENASKQPDKSSDRVLGFVSVDISPLNSGLRQICGWYNIVDFNGQSRGQIKVSITPVDPLGNSTSATGIASLSMMSLNGVLPCEPSQPVAGVSFLPASLPFLTVHHHTSSHGQVPSSLTPEMHWKPRFLTQTYPAEDTSKSLLFSSLRQQLKDLDTMTQRLRLRLSCEESDVDANQPISARSGDVLMGTHSGLSTIRTNSTLTSHDLASDTSRQHGNSFLASREGILYDTGRLHNITTSEENTFNNAVDSGAFSGDNTGKSQDAPDSQRSEKQVVFCLSQSGEREKSRPALPLAGPPKLPGTEYTSAETQYLLKSSQICPSQSPQDFSSNSQTSQGFHPMGVTLPSDSSGSSSALQCKQSVPPLQNLHMGDGSTPRWGDAETPRPKSTGEHKGKEKKIADVERYTQNFAGDYESDISTEDEMFGSYQRYRDMLDKEEAGQQLDNEGEFERDSSVHSTSHVETITPRRINDVSGLLRDFSQHWPVGHQTQPLADFGAKHPLSHVGSMLQTWPNQVDYNSVTQQRTRESKRKGKKVEHNEEDEEVDENAETHSSHSLRDRNSLVDSWLEASAEHKENTLTEHDLLTFGSLPHRKSSSNSHPQEDDDDLQQEQLEQNMGEGEAEENRDIHTLHDGDHKMESTVSKVPKASSMHLLSNVEFIDTLTSTQTLDVQTHAGAQKVDRLGQKSRIKTGSLQLQSHSYLNGLTEPSEIMQANHHLLSKVELYSTASSFQPPSHQTRHLLSNVELVSTASGSGSSILSRQSSANSAGRRADNWVFENVEEEEEEVEDVCESEPGKTLQQLAGNRLQQPVSARSDEVANFFSAGVHDSKGSHIVNSDYNSTDDETTESHAPAVAARTSKPKSKGVQKVEEFRNSITGNSDRTVTEDSGLESGAKSSQDEREGFSLADSTLIHPKLGAATMPNFFLASEQMEASMKALQLATSDDNAAQKDMQALRSAAKIQASSHMAQQLAAGKRTNKFHSTISAKGRQMPTAEEAKRIAKIFSAKGS